MHKFSLSEIMIDMDVEDASYQEFLRVPAMSAGIYRLPSGSADRQQPHTEDELYYILQGKGRFTMAEEDGEVSEGTILFVPAYVEHKFHSITEDLVVLVLFAPAEYANRNK